LDSDRELARDATAGARLAAELPVLDDHAAA
jgi:hypothetical protein